MAYGILGILAAVCVILVGYDVIVNQNTMKTSEKIFWIIMALLFSVITAIAYYIIKKSK